MNPNDKNTQNMENKDSKYFSLMLIVVGILGIVMSLTLDYPYESPLFQLGIGLSFLFLLFGGVFFYAAGKGKRLFKKNLSLKELRIRQLVWSFADF